MDADPPGAETTGNPATEVGVLLHSRGYLSLLLLAAGIGIPISLIAFGFLVAVHELEHVVWETLPEGLGFHDLPAWWPIVTLGLAGVLVALVVIYLPGHGGHVPAEGTGAGATPPRVVAGATLAAATSLVLGAVLGPEAPLIALGSGLALLAISRSRAGADSPTSAVIAAAGSAAAISAIFGNPLVAAILFLEAVGLGRRQTTLVLLPCLVSSGIGALMFTGLGKWTGLEIGALSLPDLEPVNLEATDVLWSTPLAAAVAVATSAILGLGRATATAAKARPLAVTVGAGLLAGGSAAVYAVATGHSPDEAALSGQATLVTLAAEPGAWSAGALVLLLLCKGLAYALCLGAFRGGPVFPAVFLGAVVGVLASALLPGVTHLPALAVGMAAGMAMTGLPVTSVVLVVLLLGDAATNLIPIVILAVVTALVVDEFMTHLVPQPQAAPRSAPAGH